MYLYLNHSFRNALMCLHLFVWLFGCIFLGVGISVVRSIHGFVFFYLCIHILHLVVCLFYSSSCIFLWLVYFSILGCSLFGIFGLTLTCHYLFILCPVDFFNTFVSFLGGSCIFLFLSCLNYLYPFIHVFFLWPACNFFIASCLFVRPVSIQYMLCFFYFSLLISCILFFSFFYVCPCFCLVESNSSLCFIQ